RIPFLNGNDARGLSRTGIDNVYAGLARGRQSIESFRDRAGGIGGVLERPEGRETGPRAGESIIHDRLEIREGSVPCSGGAADAEYAGCQGVFFRARNAGSTVQERVEEIVTGCEQASVTPVRSRWRRPPGVEQLRVGFADPRVRS